MSDMASLLDELSKGLKNVTHSSYLSIKEVLIDSSWKYLHECLNRKHLQSPPPLEVMDDQGNQHQFEISGIHNNAYMTVKSLTWHLDQLL